MEMLKKPYNMICFHLCEKEAYEGIYEIISIGDHTVSSSIWN